MVSAVIFDLGDVLLYEPQTNLMSVVPASIKSLYPEGKLPPILKRTFAFVDCVSGKDSEREFLIGTMKADELIQVVQKYCDKPEYAFFFKDDRERKLISYGAFHILRPENIVQLTELSHEGFAVVQKCKEQGIPICILSNWDPFSFPLIKDKFKELFALFDEQSIVTSFKVGHIKPDVQMFEYLVDNLNLVPSQAIFIDNTPINVHAAREYGIAGIIHHHWHHTKEELRKYGISVI